MDKDSAIEFEGAVLYADFTDPAGSGIGFGGRRQITARVAAAGGSIVEFQPFRLWALVPRATAAVQLARELLGAVAAQQAETRGLSARVLLGWGRARVDGNRLHSDWSYHMPGQIPQVPRDGVAATTTFTLQLGATAQSLARPLAGGGDLHLLRLSELPESEETRMAGMDAGDDAVFASIEIKLRGEQRVVRSADCPLLIGRDRSCHLLVHGDMASRVHGRIEYDGRKFVYQDESRNGSHVLTAAGEEVFIRGDRIVLVGEGAISPGAPLAKQTGEVIRYRCRASRLSMQDAAAGDTRPLDRG